MTLKFSLTFGLTVTIIGMIVAIIKGNSRTAVQAVGAAGIILTLIMAINSRG
jgi:hypothetical protein